MREVLFAFVMPHFCPLIADDTGLIFKEKKNGMWIPSAMLRYTNIDAVDFYGSNTIITMMSGKQYKAAVLQKERLIEIFKDKGIFCVDHGHWPFERM